MDYGPCITNWAADVSVLVDQYHMVYIFQLLFLYFGLTSFARQTTQLQPILSWHTTNSFHPSYHDWKLVWQSTWIRDPNTKSVTSDVLPFLSSYCLQECQLPSNLFFSPIFTHSATATKYLRIGLFVFSPFILDLMCSTLHVCAFLFLKY